MENAVRQNKETGRGEKHASRPCVSVLQIFDLFTHSFKTKLPTEGSTLSVGVKVRNNEDIDRALKRFRRQVNRSRVLQEYRQNMTYMKPSEEKRLDAKRARRRRHREEKRGDNRKLK